MRVHRNDKLKNFSRSLRSNMTKEERHLWYDFLKGLSIPVKRQKIIGNYIVDFYIDKVGIVIELDGNQHHEDGAYKKDVERDEYLKTWGIEVLRYPNRDINKNFETVCMDIENRINERKQETISF